jgi:hypothetical protein
MAVPSPESAGDNCPPPTDELGDLLSSRHRRWALYGLSRFATPVALARIAEYVTEREFGVPAEEVPDKRLEIYMALYHDHLPPLAAAGLVTYHQSDDALEFGSNADRLRPSIERALVDVAPEGELG